MRLVVLLALTTACAEYDLAEIDDTVAPPMGPEIAGAGDDDSSESIDGSSSDSSGGRLIIDLNPLKPGGTDEIGYTSVQDLPGFQIGNGGTGSESDTGLGLAPSSVEPHSLSESSLGLESIGGGTGADQPDISTSMGNDPVPGNVEEPGVQVTEIGNWWQVPWEDPPGGPPTPEELEAQWSDSFASMHGCGRVGDEYTGFGQVFHFYCWWTQAENNLNVNLGVEGRFEMDEVEWVVCVDDPDLDALPGFDTVVGVADGRMNDGEPATVWFVYTDNGDPGTEDSARFELVVGSEIMSGEGQLSQGGHEVDDPAND